MIGKTYIDGVDIYSAFGLSVSEGGYDGLILYPPLKKTDTNDWAEEDGIEADLSSPALDVREISITFIGANSNLAGFFAVISDGAYHVFNFASIGQTYTLRFVSENSRETIGPVTKLTLTFCDDFPMKDYVYQAPIETGTPQSDYSLNGCNLSAYGIRVLQGASDQLNKVPETKANLTINLNNAPGAYYDAGTVTYKSKEVMLHLWLRGSTKELFWQNYKAFLYDMTRPGIKILTKQSGNYPFYYQSATASRIFVTGGSMVADFTIKLVCVSYRNSDEYLSLITENGNPIITQSGELINIGAFQDYGITTIGIKVSDLPEATATDGLFVLGYDPATNKSVKIPTYMLGNGSGTQKTILDGGNSTGQTDLLDGGMSTPTATNIINGGNSLI